MKKSVAQPTLWLLALLVASASAPRGQTPQPVPQPFPRPGQPPAGAPATPEPRAPAAPEPTPARPGVTDPRAPSEATLGVALYPSAQFLASFDAGRGQRFYLFGTNASAEEMVVYYRTLLRTRGERVFEVPVTHMFEIGRFREDTMAFPPSVTIKDYAWNGSEGYLDPRLEANGARYKTIIQIVPAPAGERR